MPLQALSEADLDDYFKWDVNEFEEATGDEGGDLCKWEYLQVFPA